MSLSVNTNAGALVALQNLTSTESQLSAAQNQVSTGLAISSPSDNGAIWAIAQNQRGQVSALDAVKQSLQRVQSTVDVATSAGTTVSDLLNQLKTAALSASDTSLDTTSRNALSQQFTSILGQISKVVSNASFNGANLINGSTTKLAALASADGKSTLTVLSQSLNFGGSVITLTSAATLSSAAGATALLTLINASISNTNNALAKLGTNATALGDQITSVSNLQDTLTTGVGNLVDANLAAESAKLQALQTKQSLGIQALSIANSSSSSLLSLFR